MDILAYIIIFNLIGSIISLSGGILLLFYKEVAFKFSHYIVSFAAGTLLGAVFFDLLPEAVHEAEELGVESGSIFTYVLGGVMFFFILERLIHWFHHHGHAEHAVKGKPVIPLLIIGDTIHNFIDGMAIAATFLVSIPAGIVTTLAVGAHEIPQEIGDFGIMLKHKLSWKKILSVNVLSAVASFVGAFIAFYYGMAVEGISIVFISIAAGLFLYIALSDLIPEIHHDTKKSPTFWETAWLFTGVAGVWLLLYFISEVLHITH